MYQNYPKQKEGRQEPPVIQRQCSKSRRHSISYQPSEQVKRKTQREIDLQSRAQHSVNNLVRPSTPDGINAARTCYHPAVADLPFLKDKPFAKPPEPSANGELAEYIRTHDFKYQYHLQTAGDWFMDRQKPAVDGYTKAELETINYLTSRQLNPRLETIFPVAEWINNEFKKDLHEKALKMPANEALALAEKSLMQSREQIVVNGFNCTWDDERLCKFAKRTAERTTRNIAKQSDIEVALFLTEIVVTEYGLPALSVERYTKEGILARYCCEYWWRRQFRKLQSQRIEQLSRDLTLTGGNRKPYCTDLMLNYKTVREERNDELLKNLYAIADGDENPENWKTLYSCMMSSQSNPVNKAAELMVRMRGFEEVAEENQHKGLFITITAPSRFHSALKTGQPNERYQKGLTARDAQKWLVDIWKKVRAAYGKKDITPYGFRVVEPHHDGCPHWHLFVFANDENIEILKGIFSRYYLADEPPNNPSVRIKFRVENKQLGSATGYIAKYITKGINGQHIDSVKDTGKELKLTPDEAARRIKVNLTANQIRQFQQIGGPSVTVWREFRRFGKALEGQRSMAYQMNDQQVSDIEHFQLEALRRAADAGDWKAFCIAMGGAEVKRDEQAARIHYETPKILDRLTGEYIERQLNRYGEEAKDRVEGIDWNQVYLVTRMTKYSVRHKSELSQANQKIMAGVSQVFDEWERAEVYQCMIDEHFDMMQKHLDMAETYENEVLTFLTQASAAEVADLSAYSALSDLCH